MLRSTTDWYPLIVFFVPALLAIVFTAAERPALSLRRRDALRAGLCLIGWFILEHEGPRLLSGGRTVGSGWAPAAVLSIAVVVGLVASALPYVLASRVARSPT